MATLLKNSINLKNINNIQRLVSSTFVQQNVLFGTGIDKTKIKEAPIKENETTLLSNAEKEYKESLMKTITVEDQTDISAITGVPEIHVKTRTVRIHIPTKNAMQSGTDNTNCWQIEFDNRQRWENPLMGWVSTGDPLSNLKVQFATKEDAADFCNKNGWKWYVDENKPKDKVAKPYALNFHWSRKTRVSTK